MKPVFSPLRCSTDDRSRTKVCQFPFKFNGVIKWDCVEAGTKDGWSRRAQVCNVKESKNIQEFDNLRGFHECGRCSSSIKNGQSYFEGFPLANSGDSNTYSRIGSKEECQTLCDLAQGCNFFIFNNDQRCFLKFGIGQKIRTPGIYFGTRSREG